MIVAVYIRVSTLDQAKEGYSLAAQRKTLGRWAEDQGHIVYAVYEDAGISGKDIAHRPAMCQMLEDAQARRFELILVWALSRLTRSVADLYSTWQLCAKYGVDIKSHTESFDTSTPLGRAMMGILGVFAQMERELTADRVRAAMAERAAQGKRTCNEVLGYDLDGPDSLRINPEEARRVRYIFDTYERPSNLSAVAAACAAKGYRGKRGRVFEAWHIKVILSRPVYIGCNTYKDQVYQGLHQPIIPRDQWERVQEMLRANSHKPHKPHKRK